MATRRLDPAAAHRLAIALCLAATLVSASASGETLYVVDEVVITVRVGPGEQYAVLARLSSGDPVERLAETVAPYVKIQMSDGGQGWVDARYLTREPGARARVGQLQARLGELEHELTRAREARRDAEQSLVRLSDDYARLEAELEGMRTSSLESSAPVEELELLKERHRVLQEEADLLRRRHKELKELTDWRWFLSGAGVLAAGLLLGILLPRARRRRSGWGSF